MDEERYRATERALWHDAGIAPTEHRVHLARNDVDVRILEGHRTACGVHPRRPRRRSFELGAPGRSATAAALPAG